MNSPLDPGRLAPAHGQTDFGLVDADAADHAAPVEPPAATDDGDASMFDTGTIDWLLPEIVAAFEAATTALRAFRAGAAGVAKSDVDLAPLRTARSHLHQAHGALELGEIAGVTQLTGAMEELLGAFEADPTRCDAIALDAFIGASRAIVEYLEDLQGGARQQPLYLFPAYHELLAARAVERIHPADLFVAKLDTRAPRDDAGPVLDPRAMSERRAAFEQALLRYIRNERDVEALQTLHRTVAAVEASVAATAKHGQGQQRSFWWAARALFDGLANDAFAAAPTHHAQLKRVAGRINLQIRKLVEGSSAVAERLYTDVLFFVAVAAPVTPLVVEVQRRYRLAGTVPADFETQRYGRIDPASLRAAREAIAAAKTAWSAIVSGDAGQIKTFAKETNALLDAVGPIGRPGLVQVAQVIDGVATDLGFDPRQPSSAIGLDVATALLFVEGALERARTLDAAFDAQAAVVVARVEASGVGIEHPAGGDEWLDRMAQKAEERLTVSTFVAELQANLRNAEKLLDAFFRDPAERTGLGEARRSLAQVGGALALLGHDDAHGAIDAACRTIETFEQESDGSDGAYEALAQSLGAVGFYVEQIKRERIDTDAFRFDRASGRFTADMARPPTVDDAPASVAAEPPPAAIVPEVPEVAAAEPVADPSPNPSFAQTEVMDFAKTLVLDTFGEEFSFAAPAPAPVPPAAPVHDPFAATDIAFAATEIVDSDATLEDEIAARAADALDRMAQLRARPADAEVRKALIAAIDDVRRNAMLIDDRPLFDDAADVVAALRAQDGGPLGFASIEHLAARVTALVAHANRSAGRAAPSVAPLEPGLPVPEEDNVDAIDAELLEIFLEEAGTVLVDAQASMRLLDADPENGTATLNLRRNFHTLKGSGRMVGLTAFGDAAWSIEQTLNDHLATQDPASADLRALIDYAIRYLGDWADDLRTAGASSRVPDALIEAARTVREGGSAEFAASPPDATVAPPMVPIASPPRPVVLGDIDHASLDEASASADADAPPIDRSFAATQVLVDDADADVPELDFFGTQPTLPDAPATPEPAFDAAEEEFSLLFDVAPVDATHPTDATPPDAVADVEHDRFAATEILGQDATDDAGVSVDDAAFDRAGALPALDGDDASVPTIEATAAETDVEFAAEPTPEMAAAELVLDFGDAAPVAPDEAASDRVDPADATSAADAEAGAEADAEAEAEAEAHEAIQATTTAANVLPFAAPRPAMRSDETRQIGTLTLSVALFNIYLNEADELLRVLTQDFAEWRHELDRFVSEGAMRAAHSLAGSSSTVGLVAAHDLAAGVEEVLQQLWREPVEMRDDQVALLQDAVESLRRMLHRFAAERLPDADPVRVAALLALRREIAGVGVGTEVAPAVALVPASPVPPAPDPADAAAPPLEPLEPLDVGRSAAEASHVDVPTEDAARLPSDASLADDVIDLAPLDDESVFESGAAALPPTAAVDGTASPDADVPFDADDVVERWMTVEEDPWSERPFEKIERPGSDARSSRDDIASGHEAHFDRADATLDVPSVSAEPAFASGDDAGERNAGLSTTPEGDESVAPSDRSGGFRFADDLEAVEPTADGFALDAASNDPIAAPTEEVARVEMQPVDAMSVADESTDEGSGEGAGESAAAVPGDGGLAPELVAEPATGGDADDATADAAMVAESADAAMADETTDAAVADEAADAAMSDEAADAAMADDGDDNTPFDPLPTRATIAAEVEAVAAARRGAPAVAESVRDDIDPELLDIFVEEGGEILPQIGALLRTWQSRPAEAAPARLLLRHLHTLKGSARMAGAMRLGDVAHDIEARVESAARLHDVPSALFDELLAAHDRGVELFDRLRNPEVEAPAVAAEGDAASPPSVATPDSTVVQGDTDAPAGVATPAAQPRIREPKQVSQQAVRVNSETLDRLVNLAGEVSISRARIENEIGQIKGAMSDLGENVERLRSQLREIELQAEFQMQSQMQSQQAAGQEREKFDPLEFDRFTRFQELTRMMAESVNDVKTLQQHLQKCLDTAETDLTTQRRMTRELQQDLMRVRMVPFGSIAERLYRVARQTSKELDKRVNLDIRGGSVEIDRGVLERMAGPFEHLLRNHIVHGIEARDARRADGKDETGELLVEVRQEGNEIVITSSDDGRGLDHDRIGRKGRELGLIDGDAADAQVSELIFHPGFSTASEVTELAGRGVGMDVVRAEATALAGRVSVDSEAGKGTRFTITLPLTLAITQVVLVSVAKRVYALPAVLVEQVQQLRPQALADAYRAGHLSWADGPVRIAFLAGLLGIEEAVPVAQRTSPVLILRSAGERIAIHVDEVVGNQEVVVKNLGPQLARMTGIAGATVLGSGDIVLIVNPVQLGQMMPVDAPSSRAVVRPAIVVHDPDVPSAGNDLQTLPTVMVVDDSLTVRRVTQRLLSREGYQVVLAKDGVDALEQLHDFAPDVMLVDIEMPRMDGFDLTRNVRGDERYRHIPIIMITSRTAEKHRRHAADLGVDAYLGKPYQEDELLELLTMHAGARRGHPA